jgi:hypothetical protein
MNTDLTNPQKIQKYVTILERLAVLLERNNCGLHVGMLKEMITKLRAGEPLTIMRDSNDIFGGMGSVNDCCLLPPWSPQPQHEAERDQKEFKGLLADLAEQMCIDGIGNRRVRNVGIVEADMAGDHAKEARLRRISFPLPKPTLWEKIRDLFRGRRSSL